MSKEKQIEEMEKDLRGYSIDTEEDCEFVAKLLYCKGYRKQSEGEWISVKERLPEEKQFVIVYDTVTECVRFILYNSGADIWTGNIISHWMPLPEAPKMKGGAE